MALSLYGPEDVIRESRGENERSYKMPTPWLKRIRKTGQLTVFNKATAWADSVSTAITQKFSIIQTLLALVIPWMASSRPFGAAIAQVRHAPRWSQRGVA